MDIAIHRLARTAQRVLKIAAPRVVWERKEQERGENILINSVTAITSCAQNCSSHGVCSDSGLCLCTPPWSGLLCDKCMKEQKKDGRINKLTFPFTANLLIVTKPYNSNPTVTVQPTTPDMQEVTFTVSVSQIREVSPSGGVVKQYSLDQSAITMESNITNSTQTWTYADTLDNGASINQ
jgi:hypothetical protein